MKEYPIFLKDSITWGYTKIRCTAGGSLEIVDEEFTVTIVRPVGLGNGLVF